MILQKSQLPYKYGGVEGGGAQNMDLVEVALINVDLILTSKLY